MIHITDLDEMNNRHGLSNNHNDQSKMISSALIEEDLLLNNSERNPKELPSTKYDNSEFGPWNKSPRRAILLSKLWELTGDYNGECGFLNGNDSKIDVETKNQSYSKLKGPMSSIYQMNKSPNPVAKLLKEEPKLKPNLANIPCFNNEVLKRSLYNPTSSYTKNPGTSINGNGLQDYSFNKVKSQGTETSRLIGKNFVLENQRNLIKNQELKSIGTRRSMDINNDLDKDIELNNNNDNEILMLDQLRHKDLYHDSNINNINQRKVKNHRNTEYSLTLMKFPLHNKSKSSFSFRDQFDHNIRGSIPTPILFSDEKMNNFTNKEHNLPQMRISSQFNNGDAYSPPSKKSMSMLRNEYGIYQYNTDNKVYVRSESYKNMIEDSAIHNIIQADQENYSKGLEGGYFPANQRGTANANKDIMLIPNIISISRANSQSNILFQESTKVIKGNNKTRTTATTTTAATATTTTATTSNNTINDENKQKEADSIRDTIKLLQKINRSRMVNVKLRTANRFHAMYSKNKDIINNPIHEAIKSQNEIKGQNQGNELNGNSVGASGGASGSGGGGGDGSSGGSGVSSGSGVGSSSCGGNSGSDGSGDMQKLNNNVEKMNQEKNESNKHQSKSVEPNNCCLKEIESYQKSHIQIKNSESPIAEIKTRKTRINTSTPINNNTDQTRNDNNNGSGGLIISTSHSKNPIILKSQQYVEYRSASVTNEDLIINSYSNKKCSSNPSLNTFFSPKKDCSKMKRLTCSQAGDKINYLFQRVSSSINLKDEFLPKNTERLPRNKSVRTSNSIATTENEIKTPYNKSLTLCKLEILNSNTHANNPNYQPYENTLQKSRSISTFSDRTDFIKKANIATSKTNKRSKTQINIELDKEKSPQVLRIRLRSSKKHMNENALRNENKPKFDGNGSFGKTKMVNGGSFWIKTSTFHQE